ncbi:MBOAT family O-acyltransferase [Horticoccus sp. 23ND18S-11]|uniref:MBOAT family O-acyltransferase n=1 Tax=Horticoccus sp. 23ND18S-11 TaxID=3391832 RepID=UPI0039C971D7
MLFNSIEFALFFPIVCGLYFTVLSKHQIGLLLLSSCVFYMAFVPSYILILGTTIAIDYAAGIYLERTTGRTRTLILIGSIVATCLILFLFKYYFFFVSAFTGLASLIGWHPEFPRLSIILPIGLSFHTFQSLSYVVEVYRSRQKAEHNFATYATFVMFFPQLVAGPIERPQNLLHQFGETYGFDYSRVVSGLKRMAWGFFKKLVIADRLALYVNDVYASPSSFNGLQLTIATVFFAYQIYCDFSGYSDIAIGSARVLGYKLMENFDSPYASRSISEFWRRWHISLSTWFKDYIYVPLGGSRGTRLSLVRNLLITFGISGLWHGASWNYVIWGLQNGMYLVFGALRGKARPNSPAEGGAAQAHWMRTAVQIGTTFTLICLAWVPFRANTLSEAGYILTHLASDWDFTAVKTQNFHLKQFAPAVCGVVLLEILQLLNRQGRLRPSLRSLAPPLQWMVYIGFILTIILFGVYSSHSFIYFQF